MCVQGGLCRRPIEQQRAKHFQGFLKASQRCETWFPAGSAGGRGGARGCRWNSLDMWLHRGPPTLHSTCLLKLSQHERPETWSEFREVLVGRDRHVLGASRAR